MIPNMGALFVACYVIMVLATYRVCLKLAGSHNKGKHLL